MAMMKLGKNHLRWCLCCNLPIMERQNCPVCGNATVQTELTPPADARPAFDYDLVRVRELTDACFGPGCGDLLVPPGHLAIMNKAPAIDRMEEVLADGAVVTTLRYDLGAGWRFIIRTQGALRIAQHMTKGYVICDPGAVPFVQQNRNLMAPGVQDADPEIKAGDEVIIVTADRGVVGTGTAKMDGPAMVREDHGVAVKTRWHKPEGPVGSPTAHTWEEAVAANRAVIEKRRDEAIGFIKNTMAKHNLPTVVSFSGGKDSLATLLLTMDAGLKLPVLFINTGLEFDETVQHVHDTAARHGLELIEEKPADDAFFGNLVYFGPPAKDFRWCCKTNKLGPTVHAITEHFPNGVLSFIGQRKYESETRNAKPRVWQNPWTPGQVGASPIQMWSAMHVWLYLFYKKEPYNVWYTRGLDRIGCFLCPASDMADLDAVSQASGRYPLWDKYLTDYATKHGLPPEWKNYGLWRWKSAPQSVKDEIKRITGKEVPPMKIKRDPAQDNGPVVVRVQDGYSPCTLGYSLEAALSRPIDLKVLKPFAHAIGWVVNLDEKEDILTADYITVYGAGSIICKAYVENDARMHMDETIQVLARAFNCVGCGLCAARCQGNALYMENGRVHIHEDNCIFCRKCFGPCPAVNFAPDQKDQGFET
ncbi:MAG: phosphoadenosine phosphosulfate reductase family protein [Candidatus Methanomethylophilus sp.]|nr:phosphoadenosine phosphosulfate reductase family protein [Methanomethylophilus sp.]MDD3233475.1 phosphoadenosine phosphosulfate reductase family protein [Methanomethylophilus sp.]MDD4222604.1 phosphoadenosine phosphosulfate reductase family protein [Methanomethylophilus sp.]MDD4668906.1 phosphoadenosine phosphosulfate reductase family protein [Methanomethylophilus sp.]